jgi:chromosome segregation ATPase
LPPSTRSPTPNGAREVAGQVRDAEGQAAALNERAQQLDVADGLCRQVTEAEQRIVALSAEADRLVAQTVALDQRLVDLGEQREDTAAALVGAREDGDVDDVLALRARLAAIDAVIGVVQGQRQAAQERLAAIGVPDGTGDFADAARAWQDAQAELRRVLNELDPQRPEAIADRLLEDLRLTVAANADRIRNQQANPGRTLTRTTP